MKLFWTLVAAFNLALVAGHAHAFDVNMNEKAIQSRFEDATQGKVRFHQCVELPVYRGCNFKAGESLNVSFLFRKDVKKLFSVTFLFQEQETALADRIGKDMLKFVKFADAGSAPAFSTYVSRATAAGENFELSDKLLVRAKKRPDGSYAVAFLPLIEELE